MSAKPWFAWYPADYRAKTSHLSYVENAAYRIMIDAYYERRGPLPAGSGLYRLCGAQEDSERAAVDRVSREFFTERDGSLHNGRCDEEIAKAQAAHERWVEGGRKGGLSSAQGRLEAGIKGGSSNPQSQSHITVTSTTKRSKPLASSDKSLSADVSVNGFASIPLADKSEFHVPQALLTELEAAYPRVEPEGTLREIRAWCLTNPEKCKTRRGAPRFLNRWFERVQNGR